jgi:hypothetical protein
MAQSSQKPKMQLSADNYGSRRARYHGLRAVARALGFRDFVEVRRPRSRKQSHKYRPSTDNIPFLGLRDKPQRVVGHALRAGLRRDSILARERGVKGGAPGDR